MSDLEQTTSISLNNDTESIKKQEPKKQVNIVISYIEQNDEQGIGQSVKIPTIKALVINFTGLGYFGIFSTKSSSCCPR